MNGPFGEGRSYPSATMRKLAIRLGNWSSVGCNSVWPRYHTSSFNPPRYYRFLPSQYIFSPLLLLVWFSGSHTFSASTLVCVVDSDLEAILQIHESALAKIKTLSCTMQTAAGRSELVSDSITAHYFRKGNEVRVRLEDRKGKIDHFLIKDQVILSYGEKYKDANGRDRSTAARASVNDAFGIGNVWREMLIEFIGKKTERYGLRRLAAIADKVEVNAKPGAKIAEIRFLYQNVAGDQLDLSVRLDRRTGYVTESTFRTSQGLKVQSKIVRFQQWGDRTEVFPIALEDEIFVKEKLTTKKTATLTDLKINEAIDPALFQIKFPRGIIMNDVIDSKRYPIDENGRPIGPATRYDTTQPTAPTDVKTIPKREPQVSPSSEFGLAFWLGACTVLAMAATVIIHWKRWQS